MNTDIEKIEKRTIQYWFQDGVFEITMGLLFLLMGLFFLGSALAPEKSAARFLFDIGLMPAILFGGWGVKKLSRLMKQRLTYPRTGYVAYRKAAGKSRVRKALLTGTCAGVFAVLAALLFSSKRGGIDWLPAGTGLAFAAVLVLLSFRSGLPRLAVVAALTAAAGLLLAFAGWGQAPELAAFYGFMGIATAVSGAIGCRRYLKRNPLPDEGSR